MRHHTRRSWPLALFALLFLPACEKSTPAESVAGLSQEPAAVIENSASGIPFDEAQVFLEFNTTDNDLGFQLFLDAEGWKSVNVTDPTGRQVTRLLAGGKLAEIGITELRFESAEPSPAEVLSRFPGGRYTFTGQSVEGGTLESKPTLSHFLLPAPSFSPRDGQVVNPSNTVVKWKAPGAKRVEIIIESDELGHVLDVTVSGSTTQLTVPPQFLRRGREYKIEILAIANNGNRTIAESTFRTAT
jgi:hypothetical protein